MDTSEPDPDHPNENCPLAQFSIEQLPFLYKAHVASKKSRSARILIDFRNEQYDAIRHKAEKVNVPLNAYLKLLAQNFKSLALGEGYKPPLDTKRLKALLALNRELGGHGRCLNFIAKHVLSSASEKPAIAEMLDMIRVPLIRTLHAIKHALSDGEPLP